MKLEAKNRLLVTSGRSQSWFHNLEQDAKTKYQRKFPGTKFVNKTVISVESAHKVWRYAMVNRPVSVGTCPKDGLIGTEPRPSSGPHHEYARNGVAIYTRDLSDSETKQFEMAPMIDSREDLLPYAETVVSKMGDYALRYCEAYEGDRFNREVLQKLKSGVKGHMPSLDIDELADVVRSIAVPR